MIRPLQYLVVNGSPPPAYSWTPTPMLATNFFDHFATDDYFTAHPELKPLAISYSVT